MKSDQENGELEVLNLSDNNDNNRSESDELDENGEDDKDTEEEHMKNGKDKEELFVNPDVESKNIDENEEEEEEEEEEEKEKDLDVQLDNDGGSRGTVDEDGISQDRNDNEIKKMSQERNDEFNICMYNVQILRKMCDLNIYVCTMLKSYERCVIWTAVIEWASEVAFMH